MIIETYFSHGDTSLIEQKYAQFKKITKIAIAAIIVMGLALAWFLYDKLGELYFPFIGLILLLDAFLIRFVLIKGLKKFQLDLSEQVKLKGMVTVTKKEKYKESYSLKIDDSDVKSLSVTQATFSQMQEGDKLEIEVAKHSQVLMSMKKDGVDIPQP